MPFTASTFEHDSVDSFGALDGSVAGLTQFLRELVEITGQNDDSTYAVPVLELQFGDIVTKTSLSTAKEGSSLSIIALLPRQAASECLTQTSRQLAFGTEVQADWECLWDAGEGRYVVVHKIPVATLRDEPGVMDAIINTSDHAARWFAGISGDARYS